MQRWSEGRRAFAVETFFKDNDSAAVTRRVFRRHFDTPNSITILNWITQFRTDSSIVNKKPPGRPRTVRTPENMRRVSHAFQRTEMCLASNGAHRVILSSKSDLKT